MTAGDEAPRLRASDADREQAATRLRDGTADGRLTLGELSDRLEAVYGARTGEELELVTSDLPRERERATEPVGRPGASWSISLIGGTRRTGRWRPGRTMRTVSLIGGARLDLRDAELDAPELALESYSLIGGMRIVVPAGVAVEVSGLSLIGGTRDEVGTGATHPGAPRVRVRAFSLIGGVRIERG